MKGALSIDTAGFNKSLARFARYSTKGGQELLIDAARNFVRRVIALCPPSTGKANPAARKKGETAIANDVSHIFSAGSPEFSGRVIDFNGGRVAKEEFGHAGAAALGFVYTRALERGEMAEWHSHRRNRGGRVPNIGESSRWKGVPQNGGLNREKAAHLTTGLRTR
ncbi:MAG: hypothetical protein ABMA13_23585, partial [Chthoniobacteraceae bacterium]